MEYVLRTAQRSARESTRLELVGTAGLVQLFFPGLIAESLFPKLIGQRVRHTVRTEYIPDPIREVTYFGYGEDHVLEVLSGELQGSTFKGHDAYFDEG